MKNNKNISVWTICLPIVALFGLQVAIELFASQLYLVQAMVNYKSGGINSIVSQYNKMTSSNFFYTVYYACMAIIFIPLFINWYKKDILNPSNVKVKNLLCLHKRLNWKIIPGFVLAFLGINTLTEYVTILIEKISPSLYVQYQEVIKHDGLTGFGLGTIVIYIYAVLGAPLVEELCFRGLTFGYLQKKTSNFWFANVVQALLFGLVHANVIQGVYAFLFGLLLGYVYYKTENICVPVLFHICFNLIGSAGTSAVVFSNKYMFMLVLLLSLVLVYSGCLLISQSKKNVE